MNPKKPYEKPFIASTRVFSLTSGACSVSHDPIGPCTDHAMWAGAGCTAQRKDPDSFICIGPIMDPVTSS